MTKETSESIQFPYKETDDVSITYKLAIDYYTALHFAGHKIQLQWDGGNDSGSVWINIDGVQRDIDYWDPPKMTLYDKIHDFIVDKMYGELDYGSWAGDFSAAGTADFIIKDGFIGFEGTDNYSQDDHHSCKMNFEICIPKELIPEDADRFMISITGGYDFDNPDVALRFYKKSDYNKIKTSQACEKLLDKLHTQLQERVYDLMRLHSADHVYTDEYQTVTPGEDLKFTLETLEYYTSLEKDKNVEINLTDLAKFE